MNAVIRIHFDFICGVAPWGGMPSLSQTASRQSRFHCETELMIRAVNVAPTAEGRAAGSGGESSRGRQTRSACGSVCREKMLQQHPGTPVAPAQLRTLRAQAPPAEPDTRTHASPIDQHETGSAAHPFNPTSATKGHSTFCGSGERCHENGTFL